VVFDIKIHHWLGRFERVEIVMTSPQDTIPFQEWSQASSSSLLKKSQVSTRRGEAARI